MPSREMSKLVNDMLARVEGEVKRIVCGGGGKAKGATFAEMERMLAEELQRISGAVQEKVVRDMVEEVEKGYGNSMRCSECGGEMRFKGRVERGILTRNGAIRFGRRVYWCGGCERGESPVERRLGIPEGRWSIWVEELLGLMGMTWSFSKASEMLSRMTGLKVSSTSVRESTEEHGKRLGECYTRGELSREWDYGKGDGRLYGYMDGAKANIRGEGWKEIRYVLFRDVEGEQRHCRGWFEGSAACGERVREEAIRLGASRAKEVVFTGDTADWIWKEVSVNLPTAVQVADFYHMSSHVHECAEALYPGEEEERKRWVSELLHVMKHEGAEFGLRWLKRRRPAKRVGREAITELTKYIEKNVERMDYPRYQAAGIPIGSGPVESLCKSVNTQRLKVSGARWNKKHAEAVAELRCLFLSNAWDAYWQIQRRRCAGIAA